jgi:hypothetical protein
MPNRKTSTVFIGNIPKTMIKQQSGKLKRQPGDFPQRGKSPNSSARSPLRGTMPARLRTASLSAYPTDLKINTALERLLCLNKTNKLVYIFKPVLWINNIY